MCQEPAAGDRGNIGIRNPFQIRDLTLNKTFIKLFLTFSMQPRLVLDPVLCRVSDVLFFRDQYALMGLADELKYYISND